MDLLDADGAFMLQPSGNTRDTISDDMNGDRKLLNNFSVSWILPIMTVFLVICYLPASVI